VLLLSATCAFAMVTRLVWAAAALGLLLTHAALTGSAAAADVSFDAARGVLVASVALESPNLPADMSQRLATLEQSIRNLSCQVCEQHGACQADSAGVQCMCRTGWSGPLCQDVVSDVCDCRNGGACVLGAAGTPQCLCQDGFTGPRCENSTRQCSPGSCASGSTCIDVAGGAVCVRLVDTSACASRPCLNGGECVSDPTTASNGTLYRCACLPGFTGATCAHRMTACDSSPCLQGGVCVPGVASFSCSCPAGFTGMQCQTIDECASSPCLHGAACSLRARTGMFSCSRFVTRWETGRTSTGSSSSLQIRLPLTSAGVYNFTVDWGDGVVERITARNQAVHDYARAGSYVLNITGVLRGWSFNNTGDRLKLVNVMQWGPMRFGDGGGYFFGAENMIMSAPDTPDLAGTVSLDSAFRGASALSGSGMDRWDVSGVTSMDETFRDAVVFAGNLTAWNVSAVRSMSGTFWGARRFNQSIAAWNVSRVTSMQNMFYQAIVFNQPLGGWDVSAVTRMNGMFDSAYAFNQPLSLWNVGAVTSMQYMFWDAQRFNQPIGGWNVASVTNMEAMFARALSFNQPLGSWNVSRVTNMQYMFQFATVFDQPIGAWNVARVVTMFGMFQSASAFNQDLSPWCTTLIPSQQQDFDTDTSPEWSSFRKPQWGSCL
jgi:hypothetical protein